MLQDSVMFAYVVSLLAILSVPIIVYFIDKENVALVFFLQGALVGLLWFLFPFLVVLFG